uniref:SU10 major capsid protein n=1 Tax=Methylobacterium sp. B34 TaxID=95563 RepID=UPI00034786AE|nr:DUF5309 family protein [Methylobacterium sp. B34]
MATYTSYTEVGVKEDVSNIISNISPTKTPFINGIKSEKTRNRIHQWQEDALRDVIVNQAVEGADATSATLTPTVMRSNNTQILTKTVQISGTVEAMDAYGRDKETAYQLAKASAEVKRDLEYACVGTKQVAVIGDSATPRAFAGAQAQIDAGNVVSTGGATTALTEANLLDALERVYNAGGDPSVAMVSPTDALVVADFAKAAGRYREIENSGSKNKAIVNAIDLYVSPFGEVSVQLNRFIAAGDTLVYDPDMFSLVWLRPWERETLAKTGDSIRIQLLGECTLKHKNQKASALIRRQ